MMARRYDFFTSTIQIEHEMLPLNGPFFLSLYGFQIFIYLMLCSLTLSTLGKIFGGQHTEILLLFSLENRI